MLCLSRWGREAPRSSPCLLELEPKLVRLLVGVVRKPLKVGADDLVLLTEGDNPLEGGRRVVLHDLRHLLKNLAPRLVLL